MYKYSEQKENIFTEQGQEMFLQIRDKSQALLEVAGAFTIGAVIRGCSGDSWNMLACVDRLVELGEIKEITDPNKTVGQLRTFIKN